MKTVQNYKTPNLTIVNGQVKTTSLAIAELFGKRHAHVLRDIDNIKANCSTEFAESNFGLSSYRGADNAEMRCFDVARDGMTMVIMGYTGMRFKEAYIMAFNKMESELMRLQALPKTYEAKAIKSQDIDLIVKNVIKIIARAGEDGVSESRLMQSCAGFRKMSEVERDDLIMLLVKQREITITISDGKGGKAGRKGKRFFIR